MKKCILYLITLSVATGLFFVSCKKENSTNERVDLNKSPIANAGTDQLINVPADTALLDGSASSDLDGKISEWLWTKISGPASFTINNSSASNVVVKSLVKGVYQFELKVTDNEGLFAKDTVQIIISDPSQPNRPPVANAGTDQIITLPTNSATLDGSGSTDPDNDITSYTWTKISGSSSFNITDANAVQTHVTNLLEGVYQFELKVTDVGGLFSKDTVKINVNASTVFIDCNGNTRSQVSAQLIPVSNLSITREGMAIVSAGNKILFAGGYTGTGQNDWEYYSTVDIFDISANTWSTAELSQARWNMATAVIGNKIYFAGGVLGGGYSSRVDIYDAVANTWSTMNLGVARCEMAGAAAGNKVVFAGGIGQGFFWPHWPESPVDIYNTSNSTWSADFLRNRPTGDNIGVAGVAATVIENKIYFAGNASDWFAWDFGTITSTINIYDVSANTWSTSDLSIARGFMASIAVDNKNYWAGGLYQQPQNPFTNHVEIRDMNSGVSTFSCLFQPNAFFSAVLKNSKIIFFTSGVNIPGYWTSSPPVMNKFDIYDITTNSWSIGVLPVNIYSSSIISVNNTVYVAGGYVNGVLSKQVWKLEF